MQEQCATQAFAKYANGEYELGKLDDFGQRITIIAELPRRTGNYTAPLTFETGWMVFPYGKIILSHSGNKIKFEIGEKS